MALLKANRSRMISRPCALCSAVWGRDLEGKDHWRYLSRCFNKRELKQRRRRRNENGKKTKGLNWQNNNFARASRLFCTFLCRRCTTITWKCLISRFVQDGNTKQPCSFRFPKLWYNPLTSKKHANLWQIKRVGKFEAAQIYFLSDVFVAVAVIVA